MSARIETKGSNNWQYRQGHTAQRPFLTPELVKQLIRFEDGKYFWNPRPKHMFTCDRLWKSWNATFSDKEINSKSKASGYLRIGILGKCMQFHRVIWAYHYGEWPSGQIDHINHDRADNRIENLRIVTHSENAKNMRKNAKNASGVMGVSWEKNRSKWQAKITVDRVQRHLGRFDRFEDAVAARRQAEKEFCFHQNHGVSQ